MWPWDRRPGHRSPPGENHPRGAARGRAVQFRSSRGLFWRRLTSCSKSGISTPTMGTAMSSGNQPRGGGGANRRPLGKKWNGENHSDPFHCRSDASPPGLHKAEGYFPDRPSSIQNRSTRHIFSPPGAVHLPLLTVREKPAHSDQFLGRPAVGTREGASRWNLEKVMEEFPRLAERLKQFGGTLTAASSRCWPSAGP